MWIFAVSALLAAPLAHGAAWRIQNVPKRFMEARPDRVTLEEYRAWRPPTLLLEASPLVSGCTLNGVPCKPGEPIPLRLPPGARAPVAFELAYQESGKPKRLHVQLLDSSFPRYETEGKSVLDSAFTASPRGRLFLFSPEGDILFYRKLERATTDFKPHVVNGQLYFSFLKVEEINANINAEGTRVLMNDRFDVIRKLPWSSDIHGFEMLGKDHFLLSSYEKNTKRFGRCYVEQFAREYDHGRKVFELGTLDLLAKGYPYRQMDVMRFEDQDCLHAYHLNSLQALPSGKVMLAYRDEGIYFVDRKSKRPAFVFLGLNDQFQVGNEIRPHRHHTASFDEKTGRLLLFDNNVAAPDEGSRLIDYTLDVAKKSVKQAKVLAPLKFYAPLLGGVERSGDDVYSVSGGKLEKGNLDFFEVAGGKVTFKFRFLDHSDFTIFSRQHYRVPLALLDRSAKK
jgi:hypothetical protein